MSEPSEQPNVSPPSPAADGLGEGQPFAITLPDDPASGRDWYLWANVLALLTLVVFWPSINGSFLWDDDHYIFQNAALTTLGGLWHSWFPPLQTIQYYPLTYTTFWIEHHFWGDNPLGYRVVNLLLHAGAAVVLWRVLRRLALPGAWVAAAIWAIHPMQAESVCWISERKNVLSGVLALTSILFYLDFAGLRDPAHAGGKVWRLPRQWQTYAVSLLFFALAMFSKTVVCGLPAVLLIVLWWKRRLNRSTALGLIPMFVIGAALALVTSHLETAGNGLIQAVGPEWNWKFPERLLIAGRAFWFYAGKLLLPIHESFNYSRVIPDVASPAQWAYAIGVAAVLAVLAAGAKPWGRGPLAAVLCYGVALFPSMGFFNVYPFRFSFVADHYQYLAGAALIVLGVSIIARIVAALHRDAHSKPAQAAAAHFGVTWPAAVVTVLVLVLGAASWVRAQVFSSSVQLWENVLEPGNNPDSWLAAFNLGRGYWADANSLFDDADKDVQGGYTDLSKDAASQAIDRLQQADNLLHRVIDNPATPENTRYLAYNQLAEDDISRTRSPLVDPAVMMEDAEQEATRAIEGEKLADAEHPDPHPYYTMGLIKLNQAKALGRQVTQPGPSQETAATTRPATVAERRVVDALREAVRYFAQTMDVANRAAQVVSVAPEARDVFQLASFQRGNADWELAQISYDRHDNAQEDADDIDAIRSYGQSLQLNNSNIDAHYRIALCLEHFGRLEAAKDHLLIIVANLDHRYAPAYNEIGRIILASRPTAMAEYEAAVQCFKDALDIDPNLTSARINLDLALKMVATTRPATAPTSQP